ncbi:MAG: type II toxin-antitoxin system HicA family toxin [Bacteroidales bacterium]|nr:type II toxin-antitoxin system HicA family toxin [Bacteroidales bacterium]
MNTYRIGNISIEDFRLSLADKGCKKVESGNTGHEKWSKEGLLRPVVFQTHIDPIPEFIIRNNLRNLGLTGNDLRAWLKKRDTKKRSNN